MNFKIFTVLLFLIAPIFVYGSIDDGLSFKEKKISVGRLSLKEKKTVDFIFTSNYSSPFVILDAKVDCDCTSVIYPKHAINTLQSDTIKVIYDAKTKGVFLKNIDIYTSEGGVYRISIFGEVSK